MPTNPTKVPRPVMEEFVRWHRYPKSCTPAEALEKALARYNELLLGGEAVRAAEKGIQPQGGGYFTFGHPHGAGMKAALQAAIDSVVKADSNG